VATEGDVIFEWSENAARARTTVLKVVGLTKCLLCSEVCFLQGNGSFVEDFVSANECCALLSGSSSSLNPDMSVVDAISDRSLLPAVRVSSTRSLFVLKQTTIVWDTKVEMADASSSSSSSASSLTSWAVVGSQSAVAFPFQIVTVMSFGDSISKEMLELLQNNKCFIPAPDFDEYAAAVSLVHNMSGPRPPWMTHLSKASQSDWMAAFHTNNTEQKPAYMTMKAKPDAGKGKEEKEEYENDDDDLRFAQSVGSSLRGEQHAIALEDMGERANLLATKKPGLRSSISDVSTIKAGAKSDPKGVVMFLCFLLEKQNKLKKIYIVYFANERTLLSWLSVATFLAVSAVRYTFAKITFVVFFISNLEKFVDDENERFSAGRHSNGSIRHDGGVVFARKISSETCRDKRRL
jgi:hypothetical protein